MSGLAVYIHWPFCKYKCPYCDFNSHVRDNVVHRDWTSAYLREMRHTRELTGPREISSVFFGGGTPSLMEPETVAAVIDGIAQAWDLPKDTEITLEANPTSVEIGKLQGFKTAGINRVSLGVQAMNDADLKALGRQHSAAEALAAVETASKVFDRYTFDLIYARPAQTVAAWRAELQDALRHAPTHMSLYQLTIEEGTPFYTLHQRGELVVPDENTAVEMYDTTQEIMEAHGMPAYEISNHARPGQESRHNLAYWRYRDYAGIGPGAHGRLTVDGEKHATRTHRAPEIWMQRVEAHGHGLQPFETVTQKQRGTEMLMMGLRLRDGVDIAALESETGAPFAQTVMPDRMAALESEGLVVYDGQRLTATPLGRKKLNAVISFLAG